MRVDGLVRTVVGNEEGRHTLSAVKVVEAVPEGCQGIINDLLVELVLVTALGVGGS
jgi:hypothetical protein